VGVEHLQQALGEARELGVELELDARGQKGHPFEQALDIRVVHLDAFHAQAPGDLGEGLGELGPHLAEVEELLVVVA
jgi:hypothetical protein